MFAVSCLVPVDFFNNSSNPIDKHFQNFYENEYPKMKRLFPNVWKEIDLKPIGERITAEKVETFSNEFIFCFRKFGKESSQNKTDDLLEWKDGLLGKICLDKTLSSRELRFYAIYLIFQMRVEKHPFTFGRSFFEDREITMLIQEDKKEEAAYIAWRTLQRKLEKSPCLMDNGRQFYNLQQ